MTTKRLTAIVVRRDSACGSSPPQVAVVACDFHGSRLAADAERAIASGRRLRAEGAAAALVLGASVQGGTLHWLDSDHASGWIKLASSALATPDPASVATALTQSLSDGHVDADAALIAIVEASQSATAIAYPELPQLSWGEAPRFSASTPTHADKPLGLYAIVDSSEAAQRVLDAGVRTIQLRIKQPAIPSADWEATLRREIERSVALATRNGALLFINDHWELAGDCGANGVHLGQEDLLALGETGRAALLASKLALGISSHSIWELCRARSLAPRYIACGPVWPTTTKVLSWIPQGEDNLRWWCRVAGAPVIAIGGILGPLEVERAAACGADGVCLVRGLAIDPQQSIPSLAAALELGRAAARSAPGRWPHPTSPHAGAVQPADARSGCNEFGVADVNYQPPP